MNDEFLTKYYQPSPQAFSRELYKHISRQKPSLLAGRLPVRNILFVLATIVLIVACVRAATVPRWEKIGDIWVDVHPSLNQRAIAVSSNLLFIRNPELVSIPEAEQALDCVIKLPTWAPDQLTSDGKITLNGWYKGATPYDGRVNWIDPSDSQKSIILVFSPTKRSIVWLNGELRQVLFEPYTSTVVSGSYQKVNVHGQPAVLVRGDWTWPEKPGIVDLKSDAKWDKHAALSLYWTENYVLYQLYTTSSAVTSQDLVHMANSAP